MRCPGPVSGLDAHGDEPLELFGGVVEGLCVAFGAAHRHSPLQCRDDQGRHSGRLLRFGTVFTHRVGEEVLPHLEDLCGRHQGGGLLFCGGFLDGHGQHGATRSVIGVVDDLPPHVQEGLESGDRAGLQFLVQGPGHRLPRVAHRLGGQLLLSVGEVVVGRTQRSSVVFGHLTDARGVQPTSTDHVGGPGHDPLPGARIGPGHFGLLLHAPVHNSRYRLAWYQLITSVISLDEEPTMPMIRLSVPHGALTDQGRKSVQRDLAAVLMRWEGAPDTDFFRAQAWSYLDELPEGAQITAADEEPRFLVRVTVPEGALSERRRAGLVQDATKVVLDAAGLPEEQALRVWVLVDEQPDGTWGAGGSILRFADLKAMAGGQKQAEEPNDA